MKENYKKEQEVNFDELSLEEFILYYNQNIPASFPKATKEALEEFQETHDSLFEDNKAWTIDKHRRRVIDWLPSYNKVV
jgi:hypothetical protein